MLRKSCSLCMFEGGGGLFSVFCCGVMLEWTALLSLCVCGSLVLEMKGFCWCVCIVLLVRPFMHI